MRSSASADLLQTGCVSEGRVVARSCSIAIRVYDKSASTGIDTHYFNQAIWAFRHIKDSAAPAHVDIASEVNFVGLLTCITHVTFVDIRPLELAIPNYTGLRGSIVELPFADGTVKSLSCLHVIEHIGLGRYGDPIDPRGPECAGREIARVLHAGGPVSYTHLTLPTILRV